MVQHIHVGKTFVHNLKKSLRGRERNYLPLKIWKWHVPKNWRAGMLEIKTGTVFVTFCMSKCLTKKQAKGGYIYFGSQFEGTQSVTARKALCLQWVSQALTASHNKNKGTPNSHHLQNFPPVTNFCYEAPHPKHSMKCHRTKTMSTSEDEVFKHMGLRGLGWEGFPFPS